jgi:hypothetical protein
MAVAALLTPLIFFLLFDVLRHGVEVCCDHGLGWKRSLVLESGACTIASLGDFRGSSLEFVFTVFLVHLMQSKLFANF